MKMSPTKKIPPWPKGPWPLWGCLALDAFYLFARDVDGSSEPLGLKKAAFYHVLDLPTGETEVLGCLHHGELLAVIVLHATNLLARQRPGSRHPIRIPRRSHSLPYSAEHWQVRTPKSDFHLKRSEKSRRRLQRGPQTSEAVPLGLFRAACKGIEPFCKRSAISGQLFVLADG